MTDIPVSYLNGDVRGTPTFESFDALVPTNLLAGSEPGLSSPVRILLASSLALPQFSVVGLDANNHLVLATHDAVTPANSITPIGVLAHAATSGAGNTTIHGEVFLTGNYNAGSDDAGTDSPLVWDASINTLALKTGSVVGNPNLIFRHRRATGAPGA
jgi:hypothetical protein